MSTKRPAEDQDPTSPTVQRFAARNREIGRILAQARQHQQRSVTECATVLATSRRRYRAIEHGAVGIEVAELEVLMQYLDIPLQHLWYNSDQESPCRIVRVRPGEMVQVVGEEIDDRAKP